MQQHTRTAWTSNLVPTAVYSKLERCGFTLATASCAGIFVYCLSGECFRPLHETALVACFPKETPELWHKRFGHLGYDNLSHLK